MYLASPVEDTVCRKVGNKKCSRWKLSSCAPDVPQHGKPPQLSTLVPRSHHNTEQPFFVSESEAVWGPFHLKECDYTGGMRTAILQLSSVELILSLKQKTMSLLLVNNKTIFKKLLNNPRCLYWFVSLPTLQEFLKFPEVKTFSMGFMLINFGCPWWRWLKWATHPDSFYSHQSVNKYF